MMNEATLLIFTPKHELDFKSNLTDFIETVCNVPIFGIAHDYESYHWPKIGNFTKFGVSSRDRSSANLLHESIIPFAKAYIKYQYIRSGASMYAHFYALRALECACLEVYGTVDITKLLPKDFDIAAQKAKENMQDGATYQATTKLNKLRNFLIENKMMKPFDWKIPFSKPKDRKDLTGIEGQNYREDKLPDEDAIMAMAAIFSKDVKDLSPRDIFTTSTFSLLMAAPERGSEPFFLRVDCMTIQAHENNHHSSSELVIAQENDSELLVNEKEYETELTKDNHEQIGVKWFAQKGYGHELKSIPSVMNPVVKEAIERLKKISEPARKFAKLLEESNDFPRHALCPNVSEEQLLTKEQVLAAFGFDKSLMSNKELQKSGNAFLKSKDISQEDYKVSLQDLNTIIRKELPKGFPYIPFKKGNGFVKLKWSEALYTCYVNQFHKEKGTRFTKLWMPNITTLNEDLKPTKKENRTKGGLSKNNLSVFQRHNFNNIELRSHQPRHLLNTIASTNGMSEAIRAKWSGRADPKQNRAYDHTTEEEYNKDWHAAQSGQDLVNVEELGSLFKVQIASGDARSLQEYNTKTSLSIHMTEFGECLHSYIDEPCMKYRDCSNCNELVCTKGDEVRLLRLKDKLKKERILLVGDKKAVDENVNGARQWYERRFLTVERLSELIETLEDPKIPDGSRVKLANIEDVSHLDRALEANGKKRLPKIKNYARKFVEEGIRSLPEIRAISGTESSLSISSHLENDDQEILFVDNSWQDES